MKSEIREAAEDELLRRKKVFEITENLICDVLSGRATVTNIPDGAAIIGAYYEPLSNSWLINVIHSSFDITEYGTMSDRAYLEVVKDE